MRTSRVMGPKTMLLWRNVPVPDPEVFEADGPLDVPGGLVPVPTPGHTSGHCSYHLPGRGALLSGDTLITGFPVNLDPPQPQMMHPYFAQDYEKVVQSIRRLADLEADVVVPGPRAPLLRQPCRGGRWGVGGCWALTGIGTPGRIRHHAAQPHRW
jgi:glyoxylase-like metal-dependent hydrolase (beta-lactamase superfamily II)